MADQDQKSEGAEDASLKPEGNEGSKEGQEATKPTAPSAEEFAALKADRDKFFEIAQRAVKDGEATKEYVQRLTTQLQMAANRAPTEQATEGFDLREALNENPQAVLDQHFATRIQPLIEQSLGYQINSAKAMFEQRHAEDDDYKTYKGELDEFMKGIPPEVKANPAAWDNALNFVRANHLDDIIQKRSAKRSQMEKNAFVEGPSGGQGIRAKAPTLSDDQKAIAKGLGMTDEEYISNMVG